MRNKHKRTALSLKHLSEINEIGQNKICPLCDELAYGQNPAMIQDFLKWLRLQCQKLDYRLFYFDITVCFSFILFLFTALRFNTMVVSSVWFFGITVLTLIISLVAFIAVHLLEHNRISSVNINGYKPINWEHYRLQLKHGPLIIKIYASLLVIFSFIFRYNETANSINIIIWLLPITALLFAYGIAMLTKTILIKRLTQIYVKQAKSALGTNSITGI